MQLNHALCLCIGVIIIYMAYMLLSISIANVWIVFTDNLIPSVIWIVR